MARCPQCGAEFPEETGACDNCRVRPGALDKLRKQAADAFRYARAGAQLVGRCPGLLLLPVLVATFNAAERQAGWYITYRHTAYGRAMAAVVRARRPEDVSRDAVKVLSAADLRASAGLFCAPLPTPQFAGTWAALWAAGVGEGRPGAVGWSIAVSLFFLPLAIVLAALVAGGYYGIAATVAAGGVFRPRDFGRHARKHFLRLVVWGMIVAVVVYGLPGAVEATARMAEGPSLEWVAKLCSGWLKWVAPVVSFLLSLTVVAIVVDDVSVTEGMSRSVATVTRRLGTAFVLLTSVAAVGLVLRVPFNSLAAELGRAHAGTDVAVLSLWEMPGKVVNDAATAVLGTWVCMAVLMWYREVSAKWWPTPVDTIRG